MKQRWLLACGSIALILSVSILAYWEWTLWKPLRRARRACDAGSWNQAGRWSDKLLGHHPSHAEAHLLMARAQLATGHWQKGAEHLRQIPQGSSFRAAAHYYEGLALLHRDRGLQAERELLKCLSLDPDSVPARYQLVDLYLWEDRRAEAKRRIDELYELVPASERAAVLERLFRVEFADYPEDLRINRMERFVAQNARDLDAAVALATLYRNAVGQEHRRARALPMLRAVFERVPDHIGCLAALVEIALEENPAEARQLLDGWPESARDVRYFTLSGTLYQEDERDYSKASEQFRRVLELHPHNWRVRYRLATCLRILGRTEEADYQQRRHKQVSDALKGEVVEQFLAESAKQLPTAGFRYRLGQLYEAIGRFKDARNWYQEVLRVQPSHAESRQGIDRLKSQPDLQPVDA